MKNMSKILCLIIALCLLSSSLVFGAEKENTQYWDYDYNPNNDSLLMPFTPEEGYVSQQNPPSFKWGYVEGAESYEIVVASDRELKDVKYRETDIEYNVFNFPYTFETGVTYYWAVRYEKGSTVSSWSTPRKFRIYPGATEYTIERWDELKKKIPAEHPRILVTADNLEEFRSYKDKYPDTAGKYYESIKTQAVLHKDDPLIEEPPLRTEFADPADEHTYISSLASISASLWKQVLEPAFVYLVEGDEEYGRLAVERLVSCFKWDPKGSTGMANQDQAHRRFCYDGGIAYDWLYPIMTESEREIVRNGIMARMEDMLKYQTSLLKNPYDSHGYTCHGYLGIAALSIYGDVPEAEEWLKQSIYYQCAIVPTWGYQDGGWSQGTAYWSYDPPSVEGFLPFIFLAGISDTYQQAITKNEAKWMLYCWPPGSTLGSFGDDDSGYTLGPKVSLIDAAFTGEPIFKWLADQYGNPKTSYNAASWFSYVIPAYLDKIEKPEVPNNWQLGHEFSDLGWAAMSSSNTDKSRVRLLFKSSPFGSFNHSHADQNSFVLEAYGANLATSTGFYDSYYSTHHKNFTRKTYAKNCITADYDVQVDGSLAADGKLTGFLTQIDFDLAKGDATKAYGGAIGNFERTIVYIRPDLYVVVDDLKASEHKEKSTFQWWLNSRDGKFEVYENKKGAKVTVNNVMLDATVQYPEKVNTYYISDFRGPDMVHVPQVARYLDSPEQSRVWFETEEVAKTKMIVTLDPHMSTEKARYTDTEVFDNYVKMTFEDGTVMYVNTGEKTDTINTAEGYTFTGEILVFNESSIMLSDGTNLKVNGEDVIILENPGSVVVGQNELSISTYKENRISLNTENQYVGKIEKVTDFDGNEASSAIGITFESGKLSVAEEKDNSDQKKKDKNGDIYAEYKVEPDDKFLTFTCEADNYQLLLNSKSFDDKAVTTEVTVKTGDEEKSYTLNGASSRSGITEYSGTIDLGTSRYEVVSISEGMKLGGLVEGSQTTGIVNVSTQNEKNNVIEFKKTDIKKINTETINDYDSVKDKLNIFIEGEEALSIPSGVEVYSTRSFLSGGRGISGLNTFNTSAVYEVKVEEEGDYSFVVKYVAWDDGGAIRSISIDGKAYDFPLSKTVDFGTVPESWVAAKTDAAIHLKPGTYKLYVTAVSGSWNYDWLGFIKN